MGKSKRNRSGRFAAYERSTVILPAWNVLSFPSREVHNRLLLDTITKSDEFNNNGRVGISTRDMAERIGADRKTVESAYAELQATGFIVRSKEHSLGLNGMGKTTLWRLTLHPWFEGGQKRSATNEARKWTEGMAFPVEVHSTALTSTFLKRIGVSKLPKEPRAGIQKPGPLNGPIPAQSAGHINPCANEAMAQSAGHTQSPPRTAQRAISAVLPCAIGAAWRRDGMTAGEHVGWLGRKLTPNIELQPFGSSHSKLLIDRGAA